MKQTIRNIILTAILLTACVAQAAPPATPAPIVIAPQVQHTAPQTLTLTAAQVGGLVTALASQGVTFDHTEAKAQTIMIFLNPDNSARVTVSFRAPAPAH